MLRKFAIAFLLGASPLVLVGCGPQTAENVAETPEEAVDAAADAVQETADAIVSDEAKEPVETTVDDGSEAAEAGIDAVKDAVTDQGN